MLCHKNFFNGFTLAEIIITLGIIGIIAAMTMPILMTMYQKRVTETKLKRAYSTLVQVYRMSYNDVGEPSAKEAMAMGADEYVKTYWAPYIKISNICTQKDLCGYKSYGVGGQALVGPNNNRISFMTTEGFVYMVGVATTSNEEWIVDSRIKVDINGPTPPNKLGNDIFVFQRHTNNGFPEIGTACETRSIEEAKQLCSNDRHGGCCVELIRRNGWKIPADYPW